VSIVLWVIFYISHDTHCHRRVNNKTVHSVDTKPSRAVGISIRTLRLNTFIIICIYQGCHTSFFVQSQSDHWPVTLLFYWKWQLQMIAVLIYFYECHCWEFLTWIYATGSWTIIFFLGHCWRWCCAPSWVYAPAAWASSTSQCEYLWQCLNSHGDYMSSWGNLHDLFLLHQIVLSVSYYSLIWRTFGHLSHACVVIDSALLLRFWLDPPVVLLFV